MMSQKHMRSWNFSIQIYFCYWYIMLYSSIFRFIIRWFSVLLIIFRNTVELACFWCSSSYITSSDLMSSHLVTSSLIISLHIAPYLSKWLYGWKVRLYHRMGCKCEYLARSIQKRSTKKCTLNGLIPSCMAILHM